MTKFSAAPKIDFSDKHEDFCSASFPREHTFLWINVDNFYQKPWVIHISEKVINTFPGFREFFYHFCLCENL